MTRLRALKARAIALGVNWAAIKLTFAVGVIVGMLVMAVAIVGKDATVGLVKVGRASLEARL